MFKIISPFDSYKHYEKAIKEFEKRLWKELEIIKLKPSKKWSTNEIIKEETINIKKYLEKEKWYKIALNIWGKQLDTESLYKLVEKKKQTHWNISFIIWWAYWFDFEMIKSLIDIELSLSPMTFPHAQAIMMICEQIYRINCIKKGIKYHH